MSPNKSSGILMLLISNAVQFLARGSPFFCFLIRLLVESFLLKSLLYYDDTFWPNKERILGVPENHGRVLVDFWNMISVCALVELLQREEILWRKEGEDFLEAL